MVFLIFRSILGLNSWISWEFQKFKMADPDGLCVRKILTSIFLFFFSFLYNTLFLVDIFCVSLVVITFVVNFGCCSVASMRSTPYLFCRPQREPLRAWLCAKASENTCDISISTRTTNTFVLMLMLMLHFLLMRMGAT